MPELDMSGSHGFDEEPFDASVRDAHFRALARRQFNLSLVVGVALLVAATVALVRGPPASADSVSAQHRVTQPEAPRLEFARPAPKVRAPG